MLGGTAWLGRLIAGRAVAAGHEVVCAARGDSGAPADGAGWVRVDRDRDDGLAAVADDRWDAVLDVSRQPGHVRRAVRDLGADHWVLVSTGNVYADTLTVGLDETAALLEPLEGDTASPQEYGAGKVACEQAVREALGDRCTIARAGLLGGPGDQFDRAAYWPWRFAHPSGPEVLVPDVGEQATALLDARDLAAWLVRCATERVIGVFDATGPALPLAEHLTVAAEVGGSGARPVPVGSTWLREQGVAEWAGERSLPLWLPEDMRGFTSRRSERARTAGLARRPLRETLADVLTWREAVDRPWNAGLTDEEERELLRRWHAT